VRRVRRNLAYTTAFLMDLTLGAGLIAFTYLAKEEYHATPGQLGLIALISAGVYCVASLMLGKISDRFGRRPSIIAGSLAGAAVFAIGVSTGGLWHIYFLMGASAVAMASFWPALEADISDNSTPLVLPRRIGRFNVAWCAGFAVTGLAAGGLCQLIGHLSVLLAAAVLGILIVPLYLFRTFEAEEPPPGEPNGRRAGASVERAAAFWKIALILNFAAMGANAALRYHVPTVTGGERSALGGAYLSLLFGAEVLTFVVLGKWHGWHYRGAPLIGAVLLLVIGCALCGLSPSPWLFGSGCALIGIGCGLVYNSSIYYSVAAETQKGHRGGIHEAVLGLGAAVVPYVGGLLAIAPWAGGQLAWPTGTPFLAAGIAILIAGAVTLPIYPYGTSRHPYAVGMPAPATEEPRPRR
jgi:MFS family permease